MKTKNALLVGFVAALMLLSVNLPFLLLGQSDIRWAETLSGSVIFFWIGFGIYLYLSSDT